MPRGKHPAHARDYTAQNREAARIILEDLERYPGLMQEWAERVLSQNQSLLPRAVLTPLRSAR